MRNWQRYFRPQIWERGMEYYENGSVVLGKKIDDWHSAAVSGNREYHVRVKLRGDQIIAMTCTCPYAAEGNACKHMAAVVMALEDEVFGAPADAHAALAALVNQIPEADLRSMMVSLLEEDAVLFHRLLLRYGKSDQIQKPSVSRMQAALEQIPKKYEDRYGEISYNDAYSFACDIGEFIDEQAATLAKTDSVLAAARIGWKAVSLYCKYEVDDSDGGSGCVAGAIHGLYEKLLSLCSNEETQVLFQELVDITQGAQTHWLEAEISEEILLSAIWGEDQKEKQLQFLDAKIARLEEKPDRCQWLLDSAIRARLNAMNENDLSGKCSFMDAHLDVLGIRKQRAELYLQENDGENAIRLLIEGKRQAKESKYLGVECDLSRLLIDAYEKTGQQEKMLQELEYHIFHYRQDDLDMLLRMKACIPHPKWEKLRACYLSQKDTHQKGELMRHEQMWDDLLAFVIQSKSVWTADTYEADLKGRYPQEMLAFYQDYLILAAGQASNRKAYCSLIPYMKKLRTYPGGMEAAARLAGNWRTQYKRRTAMLDELEKAGF